MFRQRRFINIRVLSKHLFDLCSPHANLRCRSPPTLTSRKYFKVAVIGGANPTAQTLSLLLKEHPLITRLSLFDVPKSTRGVSLDLSHIPSATIVESQISNDMATALRDCDIVVLAASSEKKVDQSDRELFLENMHYILQSANAVHKFCPNAFIVNLIEPINYTVPFISKIMGTCDVYNRKKLIGVTGRDSMRAQACLHAVYKLPEDKLFTVPVICGHSSKTSVPLLSHITPWFNVDKFAAVLITENVRGAEKQVLTMKGGKGRSSLSNAYAGLRAVSSILRALDGHPTKLIALVDNNEHDTKFYSSPVTITNNGISEIQGYKIFSTLEEAYLQDATKLLAHDVKDAESHFRELTKAKIIT